MSGNKEKVLYAVWSSLPYQGTNMIHPAIRETFERYVQEIHRLGNGGFGLRQGFLEPSLGVTTTWPGAGTVVVQNDAFMNGWDCGRTAFRIGEDLRSQGFAVKYKFTKSAEGSVQNYVEILDPTTERWVQVDATPWYECLDPGHVAAGEHTMITKERYAKLFLTKNGGPLLSVDKVAEQLFIETYMGCGYTSTEDRIEALRAAKTRGEKPRATPEPHYELFLFSKLCRSVVDQTLDKIMVSVALLNATKTFEYRERFGDALWREEPVEALSRLVGDGIISVNVADYADFLCNQSAYLARLNAPLAGKNSFAAFSAIARQSPTKARLVENLTANLGALTNLVLHLPPTLVCTDGYTYVDVPTGMSGSFKRCTTIDVCIYN